MDQDWGFQREQELSYIAYLLQNPSIVEVFADRLGGIHLAYPPAQRIMEQILVRWNDLKVVPTMIELESDIRQKWAAQPGSGIEWDEVEADLREVATMPVTAVTGDQLSKFLTIKEVRQIGQRLTGVKEESVRPALSQLQDDIENLLILGTQDTNLGIFPYSEEVISNPMTYIGNLYGGEPLPWGIPGLDERWNGGMLPGELAVICAATGTGKSLVLFHVAINVALRQKKRVIYYALDNPEGECVSRVFANTTNRSILEPTTDSEMTKLLRFHLGNEPNTRLCLKDYPPESVTVLDIARHARMVRRFWAAEDMAKGIPEDQAGKLGLIIVDYGDLVRPLQHHKEMRHNLKSVFDGLMGLAKREKVPVITATQGNRESLGQELVTMRHLAEAFNKAWAASFVLTLCQTSTERAMTPSQFRIFVNKARRPDCDYIVPMLIDYKTMRICQNPDEEIRTIQGNPLPKGGYRKPSADYDANPIIKKRSYACKVGDDDYKG